jgi:primosomal protein N' (replication factor Y)
VNTATSLLEPIDDSRSTFFVDVVLPLYLPKAYTYRVPFHLNEQIAIGKRVVVQFGVKRVYAALIIGIHNQPPLEYTAKYIQDVIDLEPVVSQVQLAFWKWMEEYYLCTAGEIMDAALPSGLKLESQTKIFLNPEKTFAYGDLDDKEYLIVEALELHQEISIDEAGELLRLKTIIPVIKSLYEKGIVMIREEIQETYRPKLLTCIRFTEKYRDSEEEVRKLFDSLEKTPKQLEVLMTFVSAFPGSADIPKKALLEKSKASQSSLNTLVNKGVFEIYEIEIDRIAQGAAVHAEIDLTPAQQKALGEIHLSFESKETVLLHGVTSSGKTLVYSKLIREQVEKGKQVLYLLPEVALTSQIIQRITAIFGNTVCVWHYKFNDFERLEIWNKIREGKFKIIIGTRSSVFLPFHELGLIIVDEEHDQSYKQSDPAPRYHARDAAVVLAGLHSAKTLLGTATPSVETYYNVHQQKYGLVQINERFAGMQMPEILLADVSQATKDKTIRFNFTPELLEKIKEALGKKEQVILFQNRKGYVPVTECMQCAWTPHCVNCDITLTFYKHLNILKCHYCGYKTKPVEVCGACGSVKMKLVGFGTEKIEDDLRQLLPEVKIARLDYDTTRSREGHTRIINDFRLRNVDVLVGTQMVSKGLDFENVTVVGIMDADQSINIPDFRSAERAFQILTQVSGRAGRLHKKGEVIIQTRRPYLDIFQLVMDNNFEALYLHELEERQKFMYPPFTRLIRLTLKHKDENELKKGSEALAIVLRKELGEMVLGPETNYISRIQNLYIRNILIKIPHHTVSLKKSKEFIRSAIRGFIIQKENKSLRVYIDVDTY